MSKGEIACSPCNVFHSSISLVCQNEALCGYRLRPLFTEFGLCVCAKRFLQKGGSILVVGGKGILTASVILMKVLFQ